MRTIFAEYNPQCNSIDVYTSAGYMLRIDCWEAEKNLKTTDTSSRVTSSYKICKLGCCPLFSMDAIYRGAMFSLSANWLREIPFAFLCSAS